VIAMPIDPMDGRVTPERGEHIGANEVISQK
jgi:hypothetical protein